MLSVDYRLWAGARKSWGRMVQTQGSSRDQESLEPKQGIRHGGNATGSSLPLVPGSHQRTGTPQMRNQRHRAHIPLPPSFYLLRASH